jgi:hypothetical protein
MSDTNNKRELMAKAIEKRLGKSNDFQKQDSDSDSSVDEQMIEQKDEILIEGPQYNDIEKAIFESMKPEHKPKHQTKYEREMEMALKMSLEEDKSPIAKNRIDLNRRDELEDPQEDVYVKIVKFRGYWNKEDVINNPNCIFMFGDNAEQINTKVEGGGQAIIRGLPNAMGLPTKASAGIDDDDYFTDDKIELNKAYLTLYMELIKDRIIHDTQIDTLVVPEVDFGTGWADLDTRAPETYNWLKKELKQFYKKIKLLKVVSVDNSSNNSD